MSKSLEAVRRQARLFYCGPDTEPCTGNKMINIKDFLYYKVHSLSTI